VIFRGCPEVPPVLSEALALGGEAAPCVVSRLGQAAGPGNPGIRLSPEWGLPRPVPLSQRGAKRLRVR